MALSCYLEQKDSRQQQQLLVVAAAAVVPIAVSVAQVFESAALRAGQMLDVVPGNPRMSAL
jgi:hypothetical protein